NSARIARSTRSRSMISCATERHCRIRLRHFAARAEDRKDMSRAPRYSRGQPRPGRSVMRIGVPKEIKVHEYRVGLTPSSVAELTRRGHSVIVETRAGAGIGFRDQDYERVGGRVAKDAADVFGDADLIVKVKEPQPEECRRLRDGQILFTYLHLAADRAQAEGLLASGVSAIAYETVTSADGGLPLLAPMSAVAGRMSIQVGARGLEKEAGGLGKLLGGVPGVAPAKVVILGGGIAGTNAADIAVGIQADVVVLEKSVARMRWLNDQFEGRLTTVMSNEETIRDHVPGADLVIGAVLVPGAAAPKLIRRELVREMRDGTVIVDIAIDQGGCVETSRRTTHQHPMYVEEVVVQSRVPHTALDQGGCVEPSRPTTPQNPMYVEEGVVHSCVTNMPGSVPHTSALALNN